jgi:hypothetical protein
MAARRHPEQGFRTCLGILALTRTYDNARVDAACRRGMSIRARSVACIRSTGDADRTDRWRVCWRTPAALSRRCAQADRRIRAAIINPDLLTTAERIQYEGYPRRERTNAAILTRRSRRPIKEIVRETGHSPGLACRALRGQRSDVFRARQNCWSPILPESTRNGGSGDVCVFVSEWLAADAAAIGTAPKVYAVFPPRPNNRAADDEGPRHAFQIVDSNNCGDRRWHSAARQSAPSLPASTQSSARRSRRNSTPGSNSAIQSRHIFRQRRCEGRGGRSGRHRFRRLAGRQAHRRDGRRVETSFPLCAVFCRLNQVSTKSAL